MNDINTNGGQKIKLHIYIIHIKHDFFVKFNLGTQEDVNYYSVIVFHFFTLFSNINMISYGCQNYNALQNFQH